MSEVEKLYKNAGVEPKYKDYRTKNGKTYEDKNPNNRNIRLLYPPFTAEKQLELIKWLMHKASFHAFFTKLETDSNVYVINYCTVQYHHYKFESALSALITDIWQDLTEQERTEIRSILNGSN